MRRHLQDIFKMSWSIPIYLRLGHTPSRRFQEVLKTSCQEVFKIFSRRLQDIFQTRPQDIVKKSSRRLTKASSRDFEDIFKKSCKAQQIFVCHVVKTFPTRQQRNSFSSSRTSWRRLENILENENLLRWRRLQDVWKTCLEDIFKTSLRQKKWKYLYLINLNVHVSNKSIFDKSISYRSKANPESLIRTQ